MTRIDDTARTLNTLGLAAWFGGSLMGAVSLANVSGDESLEFEDAAWRRWSPVQTAAICAHLIGAAKLTTTNKGRLGVQRGVPSVAIFKAVTTAGALGATIYASKLGRAAHREMTEQRDDDGNPDSSAGSSTVKRLRVVQMAVPILTGAMLVADARLGEQQRPMQVLKGAAERLVPDALHSVPDALQSVPTALQAVSEKLQAIPIVDTSRELTAKAGGLAGAASSGITEPILKALH